MTSTQQSTVYQYLDKKFNTDLKKINELADMIRKLENGDIDKLDIKGKLILDKVNLSNQNNELKISSKNYDLRIGSRPNQNTRSSIKYDPIFKSNLNGIKFYTNIVTNNKNFDIMENVITENERKDLQIKGNYLPKGDYLPKDKYVKGNGWFHFGSTERNRLVCNVHNSGYGVFCVPAKKEGNKYIYSSYKYKFN